MPNSAPRYTRQRSDEHRGGVERGADPRALVDADAEVPSEIGEAQRQETGGQRRDPRAHDDREDAEQRAVGKVGRQRGPERRMRRACDRSWPCGAFDMFARSVSYGFVRTVTTADNPDRNRVVSVESSSAILTGTRCTTFVKLPVALSGGRSANCDPLAGAISSTRPWITSPGYTSMRMSTGSPTLMFVSCVSRKFACTHAVPPTNDRTCVPGDTSCPGRTCRSPTVPSAGATMRV